ncbi:MAG: RNA polymerase sigma factor [Candidatus Peregrinibacteria bacterium]|nr:RNA polymerase sigma factor [Candidatus Peregrinibacteria bacterium]
MNDFSDLQLVENYIAGDEEALRLLIERYTNVIFAFVSRYVKDDDVAADVVQDVFIKMWKNLESFDRGKNFRVWLYSIAKNTALDFLKKRKLLNFSAISEDEVFDVEDVSPLPNEILKKADEGAILNEALKQLPSLYREILLLYYKDDFNFREISEVTGKPLNTVKSIHLRAMKMLRKILKK